MNKKAWLGKIIIAVIILIIGIILWKYPQVIIWGINQISGIKLGNTK